MDGDDPLIGSQSTADEQTTGEQMDFKIEKGYPLPDAWPGFVRTLRKLKVGDSFHIPDPGLATQATIWALARREGIRVSCRQMQGGLRVWRVEDRQHMDTASVKRVRKDLNRHMRHEHPGTFSVGPL